MAKEITSVQLYINSQEYDSYVAYCVALEKDLNIEVIDVSTLTEPFSQKTPTLKYQGLIIDNRALITEYLEERFPYPPLYPFVPILKAQCRDWCSQITNLIEGLSNKLPMKKTESYLKISQYLEELEVALEDQEYLMGEEFNIVDLMIGSMIFLAGPENITVKNNHKVLIRYLKKLLKRTSLRNLYNKLYLKRVPL